MKHLARLLAATLSAAALSAAQAADPAAANNPHSGMQLPGNPHAGMAGMAAPVIRLTQEGRVVSTIDHPQYSYIEVRQGKQTRWLAATRMAVKKGDTIRFDDGMAMHNFYSSSLKRTFPSITFVNRAEVGGKGK